MIFHADHCPTLSNSFNIFFWVISLCSARPSFPTSMQSSEFYFLEGIYSLFIRDPVPSYKQTGFRSCKNILLMQMDRIPVLKKHFCFDKCRHTNGQDTGPVKISFFWPHRHANGRDTGPETTSWFWQCRHTNVLDTDPEKTSFVLIIPSCKRTNYRSWNIHS